MNANSELQAEKDGVAPSDIEVYVQCHKGTDPSQPDLLRTEAATARLVR